MQRSFPIKTSAWVMIQPLPASSHGFVTGGFGAGGAQRTEDLQRSLPALSPVMPWMEQVRAHPALSIWALLGRAGCWRVPPFHGHLSFSPMS